MTVGFIFQGLLDSGDYSQSTTLTLNGLGVQHNPPLILRGI